jgi:hypothetical protein
MRGVFQIKPHGLLYEKGVVEKQVSVGRWKGMPVFFETGRDSVWPFDPFAAAFYLVSRYEEYRCAKRDRHGRYPAANSLAWRNGFLNLPVIDIWAETLRKHLLERAPGLPFRANRYRFLLTVDVDVAYAHLYKGFLRTLPAYGKLLASMDFKAMVSRTKCLAGRASDPYDTYSEFVDLKDRHQAPIIFFFLLGNYGLYDRNLSWRHPGYRNLIKSISLKFPVGIHLSYGSTRSADRQKEEKARLENILRRPIVDSRQHFLKLDLPESYRRLIEIGIKNDHTMGYPDAAGFRAGICTPFYFYDLEKERKTDLKVFPFAFMDGTFIDYRRSTPEEALAEMKGLVDRVKMVNGTLCALWHNNTLAETSDRKGWKVVLREIVKHAGAEP